MFIRKYQLALGCTVLYGILILLHHLRWMMRRYRFKVYQSSQTSRCAYYHTLQNRLKPQCWRSPRACVLCSNQFLAILYTNTQFFLQVCLTVWKLSTSVRYITVSRHNWSRFRSYASWWTQNEWGRTWPLRSIQVQQFSNYFQLCHCSPCTLNLPFAGCAFPLTINTVSSFLAATISIVWGFLSVERVSTVHAIGYGS